MTRKYVCYETHREDLTGAVLEAACERGPWVPRVDLAWEIAEPAVAVDPLGRRAVESWQPAAAEDPITVAVLCSADHKNVFGVDPSECRRENEA